MKVLIDIDKQIYIRAKLREIEGSGSVYSQIIANGTPVLGGCSGCNNQESCFECDKVTDHFMECSGNCAECHDKTFDSMDSQEFICNKYGHEVF